MSLHLQIVRCARPLTTSNLLFVPQTPISVLVDRVNYACTKRTYNDHHHRYYGSTTKLYSTPTKDDTSSKKMVSSEELVEAVSKAHDLTKSETRRILGTFVDTIIDSLAVKKASVKVSGLGTFKTIHSKERNGRNPSTGTAIKIPSKERVRFVAYSNVKERLNPPAPSK